MFGVVCELREALVDWSSLMRGGSLWFARNEAKDRQVRGARYVQSVLNEKNGYQYVRSLVGVGQTGCHRLKLDDDCILHDANSLPQNALEH